MTITPATNAAAWQLPVHPACQTNKKLVFGRLALSTHGDC